MTDEPNTCLRINAPQVIHETIDGEVIVINLTTGNYYSVKGSGAAVWGALQGSPPSVDELVSLLQPAFDAPADDVDAGVRAFVDDLFAEGLVVRDDATPNTPPTGDDATLPAGQEFERPRLEKYTDMQDLVLLDPVHEVDQTGWPHPRPDDAAPLSEAQPA
jgi:hypothetical protein